MNTAKFYTSFYIETLKFSLDFIANLLNLWINGYESEKRLLQAGRLKKKKNKKTEQEEEAARNYKQ